MALTGVLTQGFEPNGYVEKHHTMLIPGDPGDTFTRGDLVSINSDLTIAADDGEGVLDPYSSGADEYIVGVVAKTVTCPAAGTIGFPKIGLPGNSVGFGEIPANAINTLVEIIPFAPAGAPIFVCEFAGHLDSAVTSYTASTRVTVVSTMAADDDGNGALVYVYSGPGAGQWNVVEDSATATTDMTTHRIFDTAPTTASSLIVLNNPTDDIGTSFFSRIQASDANSLGIATTAAAVGKFMTFLDARDVGKYLSVERLPVIYGSYLYVAGTEAAA